MVTITDREEEAGLILSWLEIRGLPKLTIGQEASKFNPTLAMSVLLMRVLKQSPL